MVSKIEKAPVRNVGEEDIDFNERLGDWATKAENLLADEVRERLSLEMRLGNYEKDAKDLKERLEENARRSDAISDVAKEFARARVSYVAPGTKAKLLPNGHQEDSPRNWTEVEVLEVVIVRGGLEYVVMWFAGGIGVKTARVPEHWVVPNPESLPLPAMRFDN